MKSSFLIVKLKRLEGEKKYLLDSFLYDIQSLFSITNYCETLAGWNSWSCCLS